MQKLNWKQSIAEYLNSSQAFYSWHKTFSMWILLLSSMVTLNTAIQPFEPYLKAIFSLKSLTIQKLSIPWPAFFFSWLIAWNCKTSYHQIIIMLLGEVGGRCDGSGCDEVNFLHMDWIGDQNSAGYTPVSCQFMSSACTASRFSFSLRVFCPHSACTANKVGHPQEARRGRN